MRRGASALHPEIPLCSPERSVNSTWTCFSHDELVALARAFNDAAKEVPGLIPIPLRSRNPDVDKYIWGELRDRFASVCGANESCWLENVELKQHLKASLSPKLYDILYRFTMKPKSPKGAKEWLSTVDIDGVMNQYQRSFAGFAYLGCVPSDHFDLYPSNFHEVMAKLHTHPTAALIFNLDQSHQSGSHWVAVFFEHRLDVFLIEYFDPTGDPPKGHIKNFLQEVAAQIPAARTVQRVSSAQHQKGENECGMYSIYYILQRLKGASMDDINNTRISDSEMNRYRKVTFRPHVEPFSLRK